jgi:hypothetical protein
MTKTRHGSKDPDIIGSEAALRRAAKRALQIGLETGTPVYVLEKGKIVDLTKRHRRTAKKVRRARAKS